MWAQEGNIRESVGLRREGRIPCEYASDRIPQRVARTGRTDRRDSRQLVARATAVETGWKSFRFRRARATRLEASGMIFGRAGTMAKKLIPVFMPDRAAAGR